MKDVYKDLYMQADKVRENAYAPFSGFHVGAALLCGDGTIFTGVNIENSSYGAGICAERSAFAAALSQGKRTFEAIAVSAGEADALPCGICRQFMYEFGGDLKVITGADAERLKVQTLEALLPEGFRLTPADRPAGAALQEEL